MNKKITITIDEDLIKKIKDYCKKTGRTLSGHISVLLKKSIGLK